MGGEIAGRLYVQCDHEGDNRTRFYIGFSTDYKTNTTVSFCDLTDDELRCIKRQIDGALSRPLPALPEHPHARLTGSPILPAGTFIGGSRGAA